MTEEEEIEREIQARVEFKLNELLTCVKNRVNFKYQQAFDMTRESQYIWQAFKELEIMLKKEVDMATPYNDMDKRRKWVAKEKAVDELSALLELHNRNDLYKIRKIVSVVEEAQDW